VKEQSLQAAQGDQEQFSGNLANSSHELRNALACIFQFGNILVDGLAGELAPQQREYVAIILENAGIIRRVLDGVHDKHSGPPAKSSDRLDPNAAVEG
jgi:signal transduction histidine kinase